MRIGLDIRPFLREETGVGIYFKNLLFYLSNIDEENEYYLFSSSFKERFSPENIPQFKRMHFRDFKFPVKAVNFFWRRFCWPPLDKFFNVSLDLTHSPNPLILPTKGKKVITVHDLFFMDFPYSVDRETRKSFNRLIESSLHRADGVVAVSRHTRHRLLERFSLDKKKVKVIYHGIDPDFWENVSSFELKKIKTNYHLPSYFLLFVGAMEERKNLINLLQALKIIHGSYKKVPLVIAGPKGHGYKKMLEKIDELGIESWVFFTGYLEKQQLRGLYRLASLFVFPSLCEGFGLPLLEAMASGLPIVSSERPALPEVAAEGALYFKPEEPKDIAEKIILALKDENLRRKLIARGKKRACDFSWEKTALETLRFYRAIVNE